MATKKAKKTTKPQNQVIGGFCPTPKKTAKKKAKKTAKKKAGGK